MPFLLHGGCIVEQMLQQKESPPLPMGGSPAQVFPPLICQGRSGFSGFCQLHGWNNWCAGQNLLPSLQEWQNCHNRG